MLQNAKMSRISRDGITSAARNLGCSIPALRSVLKVEANGSGYDKRGRVLILFEPHVFWRYLPANLRAAAQQRGLAYPKWGTRKYPADSYPLLEKAVLLHPEAAYKACSYGLPQILGENHVQAGYPTAQAMFEAFRDKGEDEHVAAMARFIKSNPQMRTALNRLDWAGFARRYNGPGYAKNQYDIRLAKFHGQFEKDVWKGMAAAQGQTQADRGRAANTNAGQAAAAAPAATATIAVTTKPAEAPWYQTHGPAICVGVVLAICVGFLIIRAKRSQPAERAPVIETTGA